MNGINAEINYYAILGVDYDVVSDDLKHAYRELVKIFHPDTASGDAERFREIQEAYNILSDPVYRKTYDKLRESRGYTSSERSPISFEIFQNTTQLAQMDSEQVMYVVMDIRSDTLYEYSRQRLNIGLVIDCSTSMHGPRMLNVKMAATDLLNALSEDDYLSIVTFSDRAKVSIPACQVGNKRAFQSAIAGLSSGGGTEIYQGLLAGLAETARHASKDSINHILLLTDGVTYGDEELAIYEAQIALKKGIGISAFGIGEDWNDVFLDKVAQQGGGISQYIESPTAIRVFLKDRIQELSNMIVRRMEIRLSTAPNVSIQSAYRTLPYMESLEVTQENVISLGDFSAGESLVLVLAILVGNSANEMGDRRILRLYIQAERPDKVKLLSLSRDIHVNFTRQPQQERIPSRMLNILSRLSVYQLQEKAWMALDTGEVNMATHYLQSAATQLLDLGYPELAQAAMLEVNKITSGDIISSKGRKQIRYGTRSLAMPLL